MKTPQRVTSLEFNVVLTSFFHDSCEREGAGFVCRTCGSYILTKSADISIHDWKFDKCEGAGKRHQVNIPYCPRCEAPPSPTGCVHAPSEWVQALPEAVAQMLSMVQAQPIRAQKEIRRLERIYADDRSQKDTKKVVWDEHHWFCKSCEKSGVVVRELGDPARDILRGIYLEHDKVSPECDTVGWAEFVLRGRASRRKDWDRLTKKAEQKGRFLLGLRRLARKIFLRAKE